MKKYREKEGIKFQFTPLREGRHLVLREIALRGDFNSRPSARGDDKTAHSFFLFRFQFTPLREGRPLMARVFEPDGVFQFTPLREGRHAMKGKLGIGFISIHAPPRGATPGGLRRESGRAISIHAPPRGAT